MNGRGLRISEVDGWKTNSLGLDAEALGRLATTMDGLLRSMLIEQDDLAETWNGAGADAAAERVVREKTAGAHIAGDIASVKELLEGGRTELQDARDFVLAKHGGFLDSGFEVDDRGIVNAQRRIEQIRARGLRSTDVTAACLAVLAEAGRHTVDMLEALRYAQDTADAVQAMLIHATSDLDDLATRIHQGAKPTAPTSITLSDEQLSEKRFTDAENYIFDEMKKNIDSQAVTMIRELNRDRKWYERISDEPLARQSAALAAWAAKVAPNLEWDHKPKIEDMFDLSTTDDYFFKDPSRDRAVFYDIYSNIHYGYVGRAAGFDPDTLISGASLGETVLTGDDDQGDQVTMRIGMDLYDKYGSDLTREQLHAGIEQAIGDMETSVSAGADVPQIRTTR